MILFSLVWENNERKDEGERTPYLDCKTTLGKPWHRQSHFHPRICGGFFLCQTYPFCNVIQKDLEYSSLMEFSVVLALLLCSDDDKTMLGHYKV